MRAGISTACLYPQYTEEALLALASTNTRTVEIFLNCFSELSKDSLQGLRSIADAAGMSVLSVHPFTSGMEPMFFFSDYPRRYDEGRDLYKRFYEAANILGAEIVIFHGDTNKSAMGYGEYFERYGKLVDDAAASGVSLCHENVCRCTGYRPEFFRAMASGIPGAEFVFDIKQAVKAGEDVITFVKAMAGRIRHVHISDHNAGADCLPPGKGRFDIREFLGLIRTNGFKGGVIIELYRDNFGTMDELFKSYQFLSAEVSACINEDTI